MPVISEYHARLLSRAMVARLSPRFQRAPGLLYTLRRRRRRRHMSRHGPGASRRRNILLRMLPDMASAQPAEGPHTRRAPLRARFSQGCAPRAEYSPDARWAPDAARETKLHYVRVASYQISYVTLLTVSHSAARWAYLSYYRERHFYANIACS